MADQYAGFHPGWNAPASLKRYAEKLLKPQTATAAAAPEFDASPSR